MTTDTEDLLWRRFNEWLRARRPDYPSEWDAYQAGHAAAKAENAAAVAAERERCLRIVQSVDNYSNPMTANDCAAAIRAGAKEPSDA